jgi:hypothetical protein
MIRFIVAISALLAATTVLAAPPPGGNPDPAMAAWYRSLRSPISGVSCCSVADCRNTAIRPEADGSISAWIGQEQFGPDAPDEWRTIPPEARLNRDDNPTGHAVVCFVAGSIHCFVPDAGT